jgi:hypothetical protein
MPLFDEELLRDLRQPGNLPRINSYLSSPYSSDINIPGPSKFGGYADPNPARGGISLEEIKQLSSIPKRDFGFGSPSQFVFQSELNDASRRYNVYDRGIDLEDLHAQNQGPLDKLTNGVVKGLGTMGGTFLQGFASIPHGIDAIRKGSYDEVSKQYGWEKDISENLRQFEDLLPNYIDKYERENPMAGVIPFTRGSANFWGDGVIKNLFFGVGAIGNAIVTDLAITAATGGAATLPVIGAQLARLGAGVTSALGKTSVYLSKLATGTSKIDDALNAARLAGANPNQLITLQGLAYAAQGAKVTSGAKWGLGLFNSARTEAAIEAADGEHTITEALINDYKAKNNGESPGGADLEEIKQTAADARNVRFGINMALLTVSNAVQYGSLLRAFTAPAAARAAARGIAVGPGGVRLAEGSLDVFERQVAKTATGKVWDYVKPTLKNVLTEGVYEEGGQFAAEKGTFDYYTRKYKNLKDEGNLDNWRTTNEVMAATIEGLSEQFTSSEGLKNMVIGGISSVIMGGMSNRVQRAMGVPTDNERLQSAVNLLNRYGITGMLQDQYSDTLNAKGIAQEMQDAVDSGNVFKYKNLKHDMFFNLVNSRSRNGMHDVTVEQLKMLKDLNEAEFTKTFGMDFSETNKKTVSSYVDSLIEKANEMNSTITSINESFRNPFVSYDDPKTEEEAIENFKHDTVNEWKTNLAYYSTVASDVDGRLKNIEQDLVAINPLLNNNTASSLTNRTGLKELSSIYEQKAKMLGETITEFTSPADKKSIRNQIKTLRTLSERINLALNNNNLDLKTFGTLLNFELSGQQSIEDQQVPSDKIEQIYKLGADINGLLQHKKDAQASVDALSTEGGFNKFFEQAEKMSEEQEAAVEEQEVKEEEEAVEEKPLEFVNKAGLKEIPQTDREYQLDGLKLAKVTKIADDRYEVVSPLGESTFYGNKEDADQAAEDMNENIQDLQKVKVLAINEDGTIKVEDLAGNIQNIKPTQMAGYERIQTAQEKLIEKKEELTRQQDEIEKNSGGVTTIDSSQEFGEREPAKREVSILFTGGITESETYNDPAKSAPHVIRSRRFLNNVKNNKNRANVKAILVTPNQEAGLGLTGLAALSYKVDTTKMTEAELKEFNATIRKPDTGFIAQVFVVQKGNKLFFADEAGNPMNEVGTQVDLNKVVFQTMPTPELNDSKGNPRYRAGQEAEAKAYSEAWAKYREQLMGAPATAFTIYDFRISRGIPIVNDVPLLDENGSPVRNAEGKPILTFERNHVGEVLVPEDKVGNKGLILISITGEIIHNGLPVNVLRGTPVLQYGDTLQVLNNRAFNKAEAKTIFRLLSELSKGFALNSNLEESYVNFLQNVLHWKQGKSPSKNQVYINPDTMELRIAGKDIPLSEVADREAEIMEELQKTFSNVNNKTIFSDYAFTEYFIDQNDQIASREWPSYNSYLLSASYPDGSKRSVKETPLFTSVSKPTASIPYSYMQKYAVLEGLELDVQYTAPAQQAAAQGVPTVDGYVLDGKTTGIYSLRKEFGDVEFTASVEPNGSVTVELVDSQLTKDTLARIAKNKDLINNQIVPQLKELGIYDPVRDVEKTDEEIAGDYVSLVAATSLGQKLKEKPAAAPVAPTAAPVSNTDLSNIESFETSKGSVYTVLPDGKVERFKTAANEKHEPAELIVFVKFDNSDQEEDFLSAQNRQGGMKLYVIDAEGNIYNKNSEVAGKNVKLAIIKDDKVLAAIDASTEPKIGYNTFDQRRFEKDGEKYRSTHLGNDVTKINYKSPAAPVSDKKAEIEERKKQDLAKLDTLKKEIGDAFSGHSSTNDLLQAIGKFFVNNFGWKFEGNRGYSIYVSKERNRTELDINGLEVNLPEGSTVGIMGGSHYARFTPQEIIEAKYDAELAALEGAKPGQPYNNKGTTGPSTDFRVIAKGEKKEDKIDNLDLAEFRKWHAANVPGIPFEILENIIRRNPDITAWGVFENGVAKFYRSATRGTEYHEIFEGIWKGFLSPGERQDLLNEFKGQSGTFRDRASGRDIEYAAATDKEAKERIADDFADFRLGKLPARSLKELMLRFFRSIMNFFKNFNAKPTLKQQLFEAIDMGKFKESVLPDTVKNEAAEYKEIEGLSEQQAQKFVEDMTARVAGLVFLKAKKFLYSPQKLTGKQIFGEVEEMYLREGETPGWTGVNKRTKLGDARWNALVQRTKEKLRTMGVNFDIEDRPSLNNEETNKNDYAPEPFTVDVKKSSSFDVKFTLATLFKAKAMDQSNSLTLEMPEAQIDPEVLGYKLLNFSTAFATLLERLSNTSGVNNTMDKLIELAANDSDYVRMFTRLGGKKDKSVPYGNFKAEDWRFFINFIQTFTRQRPDAMVQRVAGGQTFTTSANIQTAARQQVDTWVTNMKVLARTDKGAVFYNAKTETYKASVDKIKEMTIESPKKMIEFLNQIGVTFDMDTYKKLKTYGGDKSQKSQFANAVKDIRAFLQKANDLVSISGQTLGITTQLNTLGRLYVNANNPNQDITYFGIERKRMQAYIDNNTSSVFENEFNESATLDELLEKRPELKDIFSTNSQILKKGGLYFDKEGNRIREIKVMTIQGVDDSDAGDSKSISKLGLGEGLSLEINQNLNGNYYILIPADSSTEWMMNVGNQVSYQEFVDGKAWNKIYKIYKGYLMDDIALARDFKNRGKLKNVKERAKELRFFNDILRPKTLNELNSMIADKSVSMDEITKYVNENQESINQDVAAFIDGIATKTMNLLRSNSQISYVEGGVFWESLDNGFARENKIDKNKPIIEDVAKQILLFRTANYTISNIEYHKMLFGDPLQFSTEDGKFDETKRIKSFLSPRKTTFDMAEFDNFLNDNMNEVAGIMLQPGDPGYYNHKAYTRTVTLVDPKIASVLANTIPAYVGIKEADAASWLMDNTFREIKLKNGQWSDEAENFHQWQMAYTRKKLAAKGKYTYRSPELKAYDEKLTSTPSPKYTLEVLKPIVSGVKYNANNINLVLDKFSQMPIYYSMVEGKSLEKFYIQMLEQGYGYAIVESGRKVGAEGLHNLYNPNGTFNEEVFNNFVDVPWKAYGIQVENIYDEGKEQTRGSQPTKLVSIDLFANGQVFAATGQRAEYIKELYKRNVRDLDRMHVNAYNRLLKKLGIIDNGQGFTLEDKQALSELLVYEMFRRELSENAKDTVRLNEEDEFNIPFEASPSYVQIRNIIYSMINKAILSPSMGGKPLVQAPVTMWENAEKGRSLVQKTDEGWKKISREAYEALDDSKKKKVRMTSDTLKFYTKDQPYMEVLLPHWFKDKLAAKKFKTEEELLNYINNSPDGAKILRGIGFRIPTQSLSSIDSFKVVGFLPQYMGDTVIVPTELVTKAGSDFDIDKLNTYLRNVYVDATGNLRLVKYKGSEEATKEFFTKVYEDTIQTEIDRIEKFEEFRDKLYDVLFKMEGLQDYSSESITAVLDEQEIDFFRNHKNLFKEIVKQAADANVDASEYVAQQVENLADKKTKLTKKILNDKLKTEFVEDMYKRSLENEYYDSFEELLTLPENRQRLLSPVGDGGLKEIALEIEDLTNDREADVKNKILDPNYMATLRHAFLTAKRWVGIGAVNITNQSLSQKVTVIMDPERIKDSPAFDQKFLGDGTLLLPHNKVTINGKEYISMSGVMDADNKLYISDGLSGYITSFVDVAKDPYIMKIIRSDKAVGTFMLMQRIGVPIRTAALFMNQPIIKQYLELVEGTGSRGLFRAANMKNIRNRFPVKDKDQQTVEVAKTIDTEALAENIREFANNGKLSTLKKNAEQQLIFDQFLRLAMMAKYNFSFTQAINFDTTKFKSSDALGRKIMKSDIAKETNIFTSPEEVLNNSHIGLQKRILDMSDDAVGSIFVLDQDRFRGITDKILDQYKRKEYMSEDDYARTANKIRASFLDYIIQTKTGLNAAIKPLLIDANTSVATRLAEAKTLYANELPILRQLEVRFNRDNGIHTVMLMANVKDAASENMYIGMMRELRNNPKTNQLYKDLITLSILQGTYQTGVSIKNIIPIEDYSAIVAPVIGGLQVTEDMDAFADGMFQRNNWDDNNVFYPVREVFFKTTADRPTFSDIAGEEVYEYYSPVFPNNEALKIKSSDRKILYLDENYDNEAINSGDYVKIRRIVANKNGGELVDVLKGVGVSGKAYAFMKKAGNPILTQVLGYQKVTYPDGTPVTIGVKNYKNEIENKYVYKLINLYGEGAFGSEYYTDFKPSVVDNNTLRIKNEIPNADIIAALSQNIKVDDIVQQSPTPTTATKITTPSGKLKLKDGKEYLISDINADLLEKIGYKPKEIGKLLKSIC